MTSRNSVFCSSKLVLFCVAAGAAAAFIPFSAKAVPQGSYDRTCQNIQDVGDRRQPQMTAECRDTGGNFRFSSLLYGTCRGEVSNNNGQLVCDGGRPGNARPANEDQSGYAGPRGYNDQQGYNDQRDYNGQANANPYGNAGGSGRDIGRSAYNDNPADLPGGAWAQSCRDARMNGSVLTAQCRTGNSWFNTRIDVQSCRTGRVRTRLGQFACE